MKINELEVSGFRGFRNKVAIPIGNGFTIVTGRNGTGKTTVCDAIEFGMTGKLGRFAVSQRDKRDRGSITEKGERIEDYVWWRGKSPAPDKHVRLRFIDYGGRKTDHLYESSSPNTPQLDFLYHGDQTPENPLELLCQTAILRDELITALSTDLRETERFEFVNAAIGVSELIAVEKRASGILSDCSEEMKRLETLYLTLREQVSRLTSEITEIRGDARSIGDLPENSVGEMAARLGIRGPDDEKNVQSVIRATIVALRRDVDRLEKLRINVKESASLLAQAEELDKRIHATQELAQLAEIKLNETSAARSEADARLRQTQSRTPLQSALAILAEQGARLGLQDGTCPLCGSEITQSTFDSHVVSIRRVIEQHDSELGDLAKTQADASAKYTSSRVEYEAITREHRRAKAELEAINQSSSKLAEEAMALGVQTTEESISEGLKNRSNRLKDFETYLDSLEARETNDRLIGLQHERDLLQKQADDLAARVDFMSQVSQGAKTASDATKRISREIIEERLAALNPLLSELYSRLKPHVAYDEVKYRMRGDVLRFLRLEVGEDINPRFTFSSGQRRALGLAFLLAVYFTRPWCKLKTLVLDDPVQHIDDYRALHLAEVLSSIRQLGHQVICTIEDQALANLLCRRLRSSDSEEGLLVELGFSPESGSEVRSVTRISPLPSRILLSA